MKGKAARARPAPKIAVLVEEKLWRKDAEALPLIRRAVRAALNSTSPCKEEADGRRRAGWGATPAVTVLLAGDARLRSLNRDFRGRDRPTNVLSFPGTEPSYLGDIAIAYQTVGREARAQKKRLAHHAAHLAVHGVLHLLGYDHQEPEASNLMESLEVRLLGGLGLGDPYAPRPLTRGAKAA